MQNLKTGQKPLVITIQAKEWFCKRTGVTYFAAQVIITWDDGTTDQYYVPFGNGYGNGYKVQAGDMLIKKGIFDQNLSSHFREFDGVQISTSMESKCKQKDVKIWGGEL